MQEQRRTGHVLWPQHCEFRVTAVLVLALRYAGIDKTLQDTNPKHGNCADMIKLTLVTELAFPAFVRHSHAAGHCENYLEGIYFLPASLPNVQMIKRPNS